MSGKALTWVVRSVLWACMLIAAVVVGVAELRGQVAATASEPHVPAEGGDVPARVYLDVYYYQPWQFTGANTVADPYVVGLAGEAVTGAQAAAFFPILGWDHSGTDSDAVGAINGNNQGVLQLYPLWSYTASEGLNTSPTNCVGFTPQGNFPELYPGGLHAASGGGRYGWNSPSDSGCTWPTFTIPYVGYSGCTTGFAVPICGGVSTTMTVVPALLPPWMFRLQAWSGNNGTLAPCNQTGVWSNLMVAAGRSTNACNGQVGEYPGIGLYFERLDANDYAVWSSTNLRFAVVDGVPKGQLTSDDAGARFIWFKFRIVPNETPWGALLDVDGIIEAITAFNEDVNADLSTIIGLLGGGVEGDWPLGEFEGADVSTNLDSLNDAASVAFEAAEGFALPPGSDAAPNATYEFEWPFPTIGGWGEQSITVDLTWYEPYRPVLRNLLLGLIVVSCCWWVWSEFGPGGGS